ncbi:MULTISPECIES: ABC transporter permease [Cohnella]|uniref:Putative aldouronate transport system permease protein n=1 Tax=Cohnella phaseoli TaxID=456490 RepID=A0A3D9IRW2_9BACL|nr:ABC transporter permease subunit [Cohnella phaseoli]RED64408.1 putative aldouronate transport system permease protein [Cohnella phaseoli]
MHGLIKELRTNRSLYALGLPGMIFLFVFAYLPLFGHLLAFKDYKLRDGIWGSKWVGFTNFKFFFGGEDWKLVTFNTIYLNLLFLVFGLGFALLVALLLNEIRRAAIKTVSQSFIFLPYFISWLVVSFMTYAMFHTDGVLNRALEAVKADPVNWYQTPGIWPLLLTLIYVWKFSGYYSIIFLAAITGISSEIYESATIDGASRYRQILHITIPQLRSVVIVLALLGIGRIFYGDFGMIYGIIGDNGMLYPTTDVIDTYSYRALRQLGDFSMSSAIVLYQSFLGLCAILLFNWLARKVDRDATLY